MNVMTSNNLSGYQSGGYAAGRRVTGGGGHFSQFMKVNDAAADRMKMTVDQQALDLAQQFVAINMVQPILAESHKNPLKSELFHGGSGEETFQGQLDAVLAERITKQARLPIVDSVYQSIMKRKGGAK